MRRELDRGHGFLLGLGERRLRRLLARENTLREDLRFMRTQIQTFRIQHGDVSPGYANGNVGATPTEADFVDHMLAAAPYFGLTGRSV